ncbi:MAG: hydantoinase/oxoprolinase family protein [Alphaproteobacteria bacterium]
MGWRIGVDIGGTFTDVALVDEADGRIRLAKVLTTPQDFSRAVVEGVRTAIEREGVAPDAVTLVAHATTIVTNALLEGKGGRTALVATAGFRDVLELRRSARADLYDLFQDPPSVLVPRRLRFEVAERIDASGAVVLPLDESALEDIAARIRAADVQAVAVSLLFSFLNDVHERRVGERLRALLPDVPVYLSSEVLPEIREFERTSTTAVCAYVAPILRSYLERLEAALGALGLPPFYVMGSSGGVFETAEALRMPAMAVESGPAAGVVAAALIGRQLGRDDLLSFDMGGTTAKASLITGGQVAVTPEYEVGGHGNVNRWLHGTGHPIRVPVIDLAEVSAGGGSIAWVDAGGALKVGPRSAGAEPGPVCYGRGGTEPTVSDANVVLGYLDREALLGGDLPIDAAAAERALGEKVGAPLGLGAVDAAAGVIEIVNANMAGALRIVSIERGHDPRGCALVAFGGAGPVHAARLAEELGIPEVVVPPVPGVFSALGLVATDLRRDYVRTLYAPLDTIAPERLGAVLDEMEGAGTAMLEAAGFAGERRALLRSVDLRYARQAYELTVPMQGGLVDRAALDALAADFHERHRDTYGHANPGERVQLVNLRLSAVGTLDRLRLRHLADVPDRSRDRTRRVWFRETGFVDCSVRWRDGLAVGTVLTGPAIVESVDATLVVPPGWRAEVDGDGFIVMRRTGAGTDRGTTAWKEDRS